MRVSATGKRTVLTAARVRRMRKEMSLGARFKYARHDHARLSHDRLAALAGTTRRHLIRLEQNVTRNPSPELVSRIAEACDVPVDLLEPDQDDEDSLPVPLSQNEWLMLETLLARAASASRGVPVGSQQGGLS